MEFKRILTNKLNFRSVWPQYSAALMGIFIFLRAIYYFGLGHINTSPNNELWMELIFPMGLAIVYIALLWGIRLKFSLVYTVLAAVFCTVIVIWNFQSGRAGVLSLIWYLLAIGVMVVTILEILPRRLYAFIAFLVPLLYRFFVYDWKSYLVAFDPEVQKNVFRFQLVPFLMDFSALCIVASLCCLALSLRGKYRRPAQK